MTTNEKNLLGVLSDFLAINQTELSSAITEEKDGAAVLKTDEIKSYFSQKIQNKLKDVRSEGREEGRQRGVKETFSRVEKDIKNSFDLELTWSDDGVDLLKNHIGNSNKLSDEDVTQSKIWQEREKQFKIEKKEMKDTFSEKVSVMRSKRIKSKAEAKLRQIATKGRDAPKDEEINDLAMRALVEQMYSNGYKPEETESGELIIIDEKGDQAEDENFNKLSFEKFITNKTKIDKFFPVIQSSPRDGGGPSATDVTSSSSTTNASSQNAIKYTDKNGNIQSFIIPDKFSDVDEYLEKVKSIPEDASTEVYDRMEAASSQIGNE